MGQIIGQTSFININLANSGKNIVLNDIFVSLNIYEDLFLPFFTGKIIIKDTQDIQAFFPIVGDETIEINYKTDNDKTKKINHSFVVYKMEKDSNANTNFSAKKLVVLYFCSPELLKNNTTHISRKIKGTNTEILKECKNKFLLSKKDLNVESASDIVEFVSNFWTPVQIINYINKLNNDFIFYENKYGMNYVSLNSLLKDTVKYNLIFEDSQYNLFGFNNIIQFKVEKYFNNLESTELGATGNTYYGVDKTYYNYNKVQNSALTASNKITNLGKYISTSPDIQNFGKIKSTILDPEKQSLRELIIKNFINYNLIIKLPGDSLKTVGELCNVPFKTIKNDKIENNQFLEGTWMISKINHEIIRGGKYIQNIKLIKNAIQSYENFDRVEGSSN